MTESFENLYKRHGKIWLLKYFNHSFLAAIISTVKSTPDFIMTEAEYNDIEECLTRCEEISDNIREKHYGVFYTFHELLREFKNYLFEWNTAKRNHQSGDIINSITNLEETREKINSSIYKEMEIIGSQKNSENKISSLREVDVESVKDLFETFDEFLKVHNKRFPKLADSVEKAKRRI